MTELSELAVDEAIREIRKYLTIVDMDKEPSVLIIRRVDLTN